MRVTDTYQLYYTADDLPQHVLKQVEGIRHKALAAYTADNVKLAEWLLDLIEYQSKDLIRKQTSLGTISNKAATMLGNYFKHIHNACREVIEQRFAKPVLSDEEAGELFFREMIADYLDKAADGARIPSNATRTFTGSAGALRIDIDREIRQQAAKVPDGLTLQSLLGSKW